MKRFYALSVGLSLVLLGSLSGYAQNLNDTIKLGPVEIIDQVIQKVPYIRNVVLKSDLDDNATRDIGEVMRTIPNVSGIRKGGANVDPVVRGFKFSQLLTLVNGSIGIEGGCPNRMDPTTSHFDIDDIERIEVIKGPFALRYGPSFGGVVNLILKQPRPYEKFEVHVNAAAGYESNYNGNKEHLAVNGGNKKVYFMLTGNRLDYGDYKDGNGDLWKSSFKKYSYGASLGFTPFKKHEFMLRFIGANHRTVMFPALMMDERADNTNVYGFSYITKGHTGIFKGANFKASYAMVNHVMDNKQRAFSDTVVAVSIVDANTLGSRGGVDLCFKDKYFLFAGADFQYITKNGTRDKNMIAQAPMNGNIPLKVEDLWKDASIRNIGIFSEFKTTLGTYDLVGAVRLDLNSANSAPVEVFGMPMGGVTPVLLSLQDTKSDHTNFSFNLGATKRFGKYFSLGLSAGRGVRSPNMLERFIILLPAGYDNFDYFGNPQLKPETNNEADLNFKFKHRDYGAVDFNIFYSLVQDFILGRRIPPSEQKPLTANVRGVKQFYNADQATFMGFELAYALPESFKLGAKVSAAYTHATLSKVTRQILDLTKPVTQQVIGEEELTNDAVPEIPPLEVNVSVYYKFCKGKLVPRASARIVLDQGHISEAYYESATPGFVLLNFGLNYKYNDFVSVGAGVNNLLDKAYYEHLNRRMLGTTTRLYEPGRVFYVNLFLNI